MSDYVQTAFANGYASIPLPISDLAVTFVYANGFVSTMTVVYSGVTYVQTFINDGVYITSVSQWVPQP